MVEADRPGQKEDIQNLTNLIQAWSLEVSTEHLYECVAYVTEKHLQVVTF